MPTVLRVRAYRFFFASLGGSEPPHVHVRREKMVSKFWLEPVALERAGGFSRTQRAKDDFEHYCEYGSRSSGRVN